MITCPFCKEYIQEGAIKCKHCGEILEKDAYADIIATLSHSAALDQTPQWDNNLTASPDLNTLKTRMLRIDDTSAIKRYTWIGLLMIAGFAGIMLVSYLYCIPPKGEWDIVTGRCAGNGGRLEARRDAIRQLDNKYIQYHILEETYDSSGGEITARNFAGQTMERNLDVETCTIRVENAVRR